MSQARLIQPRLILQVAVPSPLYRIFDYLPPKGANTDQIQLGMRVKVPFGRTHTVGVITGLASESHIAEAKLRPVKQILDNQSLLPTDSMHLLARTQGYYHHPFGDCYLGALPTLLRKGGAALARGSQKWALTSDGQAVDLDSLTRAPRQAQLIKLLAAHPAGLHADQLNAHLDSWRSSMKSLIEKELVAVSESPCLPAPDSINADSPPQLNDAQQQSVTEVVASLGQFQPFLLDGVTGSGKTEVYLHIIREVLAKGQQALVLVPEIGLTPQLLARFHNRLQVPIAVLHSGLNDQERLCAWLMASAGKAPVVIGTRSAIFTPLPAPGIFIVDEEHDLSLKQQDGYRYHARDVAVMRAQQAKVPVVLGSATPSLESLYNVQQQRYRPLHLKERAGNASHPSLKVLDVRAQPMDEQLSYPLLDMVQQRLARNEQVLLFLNRRGYAPTLICHECGWVGHCQRCDAHMTLHLGSNKLRCHHCGAERRIDPKCPDCGNADLYPVGQGTERVEQALKRRFPDARILRVDRDTTRRKGAMHAMLETIHNGEVDILIGTQMLAKGHDFPDVTLVGILDVDQGLFSADFRASERMAQLIVQVAGRAGRANKPGEVVIQTHHPDHPLLNTLLSDGYGAFAQAALEERKLVGFPPYTAFALLRAESVKQEEPGQFLQQARELAERYQVNGVEFMGPIPAPMERRAGRFRAQLLLQSSDRRQLHRLLEPWVTQLEQLKTARKVRWSLDVDPMEMF